MTNFEDLQHEYIHTVKEQAVFELIRLLAISNVQLDNVSAKAETWVMSGKSAADPSGMGKVALASEVQNWVEAIKKMKQQISGLHPDARN